MIHYKFYEAFAIKTHMIELCIKLPIWKLKIVLNNLKPELLKNASAATSCISYIIIYL